MLGIALFIYNLLGGWRGVVAAGLLAGAVGTAAYYVHQYDSRGRQLVKLELVNSALEKQVAVQKANARLAKDAVEVLNRELMRRDKDIEDACKLLKELDNDKTPGADDQVHGTIGKALDALKD